MDAPRMFISKDKINFIYKIRIYFKLLIIQTLIILPNIA